MNTTVLITTHNTPGRWLAEAAGSVPRNIPLVIVDDGSTDATTLTALTLAAMQGATVHRIDHAGIAAASNYGIERIDTELVARLDADDRYTHEERALRLLVEHVTRIGCEHERECDVAGGWLHYIRPDGSRFGELRPQPMHCSPLHRGRIAHPGCVFRRELWREAGGYPEGHRRGTDWHFWQRCEKVGARFSVLPVFVAERRIHPNSHSFRFSKHLQKWWEVAQR